jgi:hypothetical protein
MRNLLLAVAALAAISLTPSPSPANIFGLFGFDCSGEHNCDCACGPRGNCGNCCEPACGCGCGDCGEPACGCDGCCEPACGCGCGCFANGRQYAGQCFHGCCESHAPICPCVPRGCCQDGCGAPCGCGDCCEPACGCGGCGEPCGGCSSGCASWCGSGTACCPRKCCLKNYGFCCCCGNLLNALCCGRSGCGCNGEMYWSEWHNDPPYCHDPCNNCGEWVGPGCGSCGGCNGGCNGASGCDGGYANANNRVMSNGAAYAKQTPANRTQVANNARKYQPAHQTRPAYANQKQYQQANVRSASRPQVNRLPSTNSNNGAQTRPIMW